MKTIGTEEHFITDEVLAAWGRLPASVREDSRAGAPPGRSGSGCGRFQSAGSRRWTRRGWTSR